MQAAKEPLLQSILHKSRGFCSSEPISRFAGLESKNLRAQILALEMFATWELHVRSLKAKMLGAQSLNWAFFCKAYTS